MPQNSSTPISALGPLVPKVQRPHLFDLVLALIEARASRVDIMDTRAAAELEKYLRARRAARRASSGHRALAHDPARTESDEG